MKILREMTARNTTRNNGDELQSTMTESNQTATVNARQHDLNKNFSVDMTLGNTNLSPAVGEGKRSRASRLGEAQNELSPSHKRPKKGESVLECVIFLPNGKWLKTSFALALPTGEPSTVSSVLNFLKRKNEQQDSTTRRKVQSWGPNIRITDDRGVELSEGLTLKDLVAQRKAHTIRFLVHYDHEEIGNTDEGNNDEFTFIDDGIHIHPNAGNELAIVNKHVIFHKHMIYGQGDYVIDEANPLWIKLPKGTKGSGLKTDLYAVVEYFVCDGANDKTDDVKFLCRPINVAEEDGCSINVDMQFELRKSLWFSAALLSSAKRLDAAAWKKKLEGISNKSPSRIEILGKDDIEKLEICQGSDRMLSFPVCGRKVEAGFVMPPEIFAVLRPRRGSGPSHKQGRIVPDQVNLVLVVIRCHCSGNGGKRRAPLAPACISAHADENHGEVIAKLKSLPRANNGDLRGLYSFRFEASEVRQLHLRGNYTFCISVADDGSTGVWPARYSFRVFPAKLTSKWSICSHSGNCTSRDHENLLLPAITIQLNEQLPEALYVQKYDEFGNPQKFQAPIDAKVIVVNLNGDCLEMEAKVHADFENAAANKYRLQVKGLLFERGDLTSMGRSDEGLLRVCFPTKQEAQMRCKVLPGKLASVTISDSSPVINCSMLCFQEPLHPNEILRKLTFQGLDAFGNKIDKGQKMRVLLEGMAFHDEHTKDKEVDENGCLHMGGLIRVQCHFNATGSLSVALGSHKLLEISFQTVVRKLIVTEVPLKGYIGRQVEGINVQVVDENGNVDVSLDGQNHSIALDWQTGVTYPLTKGRCILPAFRLPKTLGWFMGQIYFSANKSLAAEIRIEMELSEACSLESVVKKPIVAKCGIPFAVPFLAYDDHHLPTFLTESMQNQVNATVHRKDGTNEPMSKPCSVEFRGVEKSIPSNPLMYESHLILTGGIGEYVITLMDAKGHLQGRAEAHCILEHGPVSTFALKELNENPTQNLSEPPVVLEVIRRKAIPKLSVTLFDSDQSVCTSCNDMILTMSIDWATWKPWRARAFNGTAQFLNSAIKVDIPVGTYRLENTMQLCVSHSDSKDQSIPEVPLFVVSEDGCKFQNLPRVILSIRHCQAYGSESIHEGTFVETLKTKPEPSTTQEIAESAKLAAKYVFTGVPIPPQAGAYHMFFSLYDHPKVGCRSQHLLVKPGPPKKIETKNVQGQRMERLCAWLLDAHENTCDNAPEVELGIDLIFNGDVAKTKQCSVQSRTTMVTSKGKADFGRFLLSDGVPGVYTLRVCLKNTSRDTFADYRILLTKNISGDIEHQRNQLQLAEQSEEYFVKRVSKCEAEKMKFESQLHPLETEMKEFQESLATCKNESDALRQAAEHYEDKLILRTESKEPVRTSSDVMMDIRSWVHQTGNNVAAALLDAMSSPSTFLTSTPAGQDVLGMVVLLARVETDVLNKRLSSYLGPRSLLRIICRSQLGVSALEKYDGHGNIDDNEGLHGFAKCRGYKIDEKCDRLALMDVRPYRRNDGQASVDSRSSQQLLNIDPPILADRQSPSGLLGYAVNLIHVNNESTSDGVGLRESLFFHLFGLLQVYDTKENMNFAKKELKENFTGALSLDGGLIRPNNHHEFGRQSENTLIRFGSLEYGERQNISIIPPYCHAFRREFSLKALETRSEDISDQLQKCRASETEMRRSIQSVEENLCVLRDHRRQKAEIVQSMKRGLDELSGLASAVKMRSSSSADPIHNNQEVQAVHM